MQQEFKATGPVPATSETEVWKAYQLAVEKFYDLLKINKELRDYDFKKNLEIKQQLCAEAEALDEESDVVNAFKKLQELHNTWRETGPVAKELREDLWARFKNASAVINKKYQAFFEERKSQEKEMADAKTAPIGRIFEFLGFLAQFLLFGKVGSKFFLGMTIELGLLSKELVACLAETGKQL